MIESKLYDYQKPHFDRALTSQRQYKCTIDTSPTGLGKSYHACALAYALDLKLVVVAPLSVRKSWITAANYFNANIGHIVTYSWLNTSSKRSTCPKGKLKDYAGYEPWLKQDGDSYVVTSYFKSLIKSGILLVFDECHNLKNTNTGQFKTSHCLSLATYDYSKRSGVMLLSATAGDKDHHPLYLFAMSGAMRAHRPFIYDIADGSYLTTGYEEIVDYCEHIDTSALDIYHEHSINKKSIYEAIGELYHLILKPTIASSMKYKLPVTQTVYKYRAQFTSDKQDEQKSLMGSIMSDLESQEDDGYPFNMTTTLRLLESKIKVDAIVRLARHKLRSDSNRKVIIYLDYNESIDKCSKLLSKYNPLVMTGYKSNEYRNPARSNRDEVISKFQQDGSYYRLLITNPKVGGVGINLDDRIGTYPRTIIISPSFQFIDMWQATQRINRTSTKSDSEAYFVYMNYKGDTEAKLHDRYMKKMQVAQQMSADSQSIFNTTMIDSTEGVDIACNTEELMDDTQDRRPVPTISRSAIKAILSK